MYEAEEIKLKREVAIKFLPHHVAADVGQRERFNIEAQAAAGMNQPGIATIHAIEKLDDDIFHILIFVSQLAYCRFNSVLLFVWHLYLAM